LRGHTFCATFRTDFLAEPTFWLSNRRSRIIPLSEACVEALVLATSRGGASFSPATARIKAKLTQGCPIVGGPSWLSSLDGHPCPPEDRTEWMPTGGDACRNLTGQDACPTAVARALGGRGRPRSHEASGTCGKICAEGAG